MTRRLRLFALATCLTIAATACGSSGSDGGSADPTTTAAERTTTTVGATTTAAPTTTASSEPATTTAPAETPSTLPDCQVLLQEYTDVFTPDDLLPAAAFFRRYAPLMPAEVSAATLRIAAAYEAADGDLSKIDFDDVDLSEDAEAFSTWTSAGCPAG